MCRASKLTAAKRHRLEEAMAASAWLLELMPDLRANLPRTMHPVLGDLQESAEAVFGYLDKSLPKK